MGNIGGNEIKIDRVRSISNINKGFFGSQTARSFVYKRNKFLLDPTPYLQMIKEW